MGSTLSSASIPSPEIREICTRGSEECDRGNYREARKLLEMAAAQAGSPAALPRRALAAYGVALAGMERKRMSDAVGFCTAAIERAPYDAELHYALAKVYLLGRSKRLALQAIQAGLLVEANHMGMLRMRERLGRRRKPVLGFLGRSHPLNAFLGRLRHRLLGP